MFVNFTMRAATLSKMVVPYNFATALKLRSEKISLFKANSTFHALLQPMILWHSSASSEKEKEGVKEGKLMFFKEATACNQH
jgi:hypothetical protein